MNKTLGGWMDRNEAKRLAAGSRCKFDLSRTGCMWCAHENQKATKTMKITKKQVGLVVSALLWILQNFGLIPTASEAVSADTSAPSEQVK